MNSLVHLSDDLILESYYTAISLELEKDFIQLILGEIRRRQIEVELVN
ncbi:sporulation histidine kinase inhibitor Sda [Aquibacillus albus]|uniref:Developmental checkpoint coupling sporulation initiation to replication initiation n=1 Tax=Aquibacillus albus TaxID=1168171 RepID=A0ABS2MVQ1_9BACI|nr:developmental checkpoint coupling sporulation initiation to replication initiation [Aquibacillus albus]